MVDTFRYDSTYYAAPSCTAEVVFIGKLSKIAKGRCHWRVTRREGVRVERYILTHRG